MSWTIYWTTGGSPPQPLYYQFDYAGPTTRPARATHIGHRAGAYTVRTAVTEPTWLLHSPWTMG